MVRTRPVCHVKLRQLVLNSETEIYLIRSSACTLLNAMSSFVSSLWQTMLCEGRKIEYTSMGQ